MFATRRKAAKRFNLLLLEEEEYYVADWVASCNWPASVAGNWQGAPSLPGRLRLCTKSLFFDPDDVRVPIVRYGPLPVVLAGTRQERDGCCQYAPPLCRAQTSR